MFEQALRGKSPLMSRACARFLTRCEVCAPKRRYPTLARRTKEEALATRELLLDTAETIFLQRGVANTSLNDIASAAGLTRGAVYWHFEDKAALYNALMERLSLACESLVNHAQLQHPTDAVAALRSKANAPVQLVMNNPQARRLLTIVMHRVEFSEDLGAIWARHVSKDKEYLAVFEEALRAVEAQGHPLRLPVASAALGLFSLLDGLLTYATLDPARIERLHEASAVIDTFLVGLGCPPLN